MAFLTPAHTPNSFKQAAQVHSTRGTQKKTSRQESGYRWKGTPRPGDTGARDRETLRRFDGCKGGGATSALLDVREEAEDLKEEVDDAAECASSVSPCGSVEATRGQGGEDVLEVERDAGDDPIIDVQAVEQQVRVEDDVCGNSRLE